MTSYRVEARATMAIALADEDAEIEPVVVRLPACPSASCTSFKEQPFSRFPERW